MHQIERSIYLDASRFIPQSTQKSMGSSSSDNDSFMKVDTSELSEEYDASVWHDEDCLNPFEEPNGFSGSRLCHACQSLFSGYKETEKDYKHFYRLSTLQNTAKRGCQLCALVLSKVDRENQNHRPSEVMKLTFQMYQASSHNGETAFEIWFHFLRLCKGAKSGDVVWGIKTIDFLLSKGKFLTTHSEPLEPFGCEIAPLIVSSCIRYE